VPNVLGKKLGSARTSIKKRHCKVGHVRYVKSSKKRKGKVVRESPAAGERLGSNARINLWLGLGR
jgi:beta-lactam-binding protein with PASTA domain